MKREILQSIFLLFSGFFILYPEVEIQAQENIQFQTQNRASQYHLGAADELLIPINIWGFVQKPGQYMVPNKTDLLSLLSFAGGPTEGAKISNIKIVRSDPIEGNFVWNVNVKKYMNTADPSIIPILKPGDTIVVKGTTFNWIQQFFSFVSSLATIIYFIALANEYLTR